MMGGVAALWAIAGCQQKRDLSENTLMVHMSYEPDDLHPTNSGSSMASWLAEYMHRALLRVDLEKLELIPWLVEDMPHVWVDSSQFTIRKVESPDGSVRYDTVYAMSPLYYTYRLLDSIYWDDGSPLTVDDIIFTLKVIKNPLTDNASSRPLYGNIIDVIKDTADPLRFTVVTGGPYVSNLSIMTFSLLQRSYWDPEGVLDKYSLRDFSEGKVDPSKDPDLVEWSKNFNSGDNGRLPEKLVGLGPYQVTEWKVGNYIMLERKKNWRAARNDSFIYDTRYPEKIIFKLIRESNAAALALKRQKLDVTADIGTNDLLKLQKRKYFNENYVSDFVDRFGYSYIGLNMRPDGINHKPFFVDKRVRRAMAHLVPVDEIIQVIAKGKATRYVTMVSPLKKEFHTGLKPIPFDIEKAKQLLEEAGWVDTDGDNIRDKEVNGERLPFRFYLNYMSSPVSKEIVLMIKEAMYQAGVEVVPNPMDFAIFYKKAANHDFDAMMGGWSSSALPNDFSQLWHTRSWANKGYNFVGFGTPESDSLIELANRTIDPEERIRIVRRLQEIVYDEQPYVFLFSTKRKIAIHRRFDNTEMYKERPGVILNNLKLKEEYARRAAAGHQPDQPF